MTAMQESPRCIMVHDSSNIDSVLDLKGMTLAVGSGKPYAKFLLSKLGGADLTVVPYQGSVTAFLQDKQYAQQAYVFSEPYVARQQGASTRCLMISEIGFNPYTSLLITSEQVIQEDPELVARVVRASVRGWQRYLEEPGETNQAIHALNPEMSLEILAFGAEQIRPLCLSDSTNQFPWGAMSDQRWQTLAEQLRSIGLLDDTSVWQDAFDLTFLPGNEQGKPSSVDPADEEVESPNG
jgi:NitT/TauT family transport system substrate-binding protein